MKTFAVRYEIYFNFKIEFETVFFPFILQFPQSQACAGAVVADLWSNCYGVINRYCVCMWSGYDEKITSETTSRRNQREKKIENVLPNQHTVSVSFSRQKYELSSYTNMYYMVHGVASSRIETISYCVLPVGIFIRTHIAKTTTTTN